MGIRHKTILIISLGINLIKYVQDLYEKNYETLMNEIKEELNKWRNTPCSWRGKLNTVMMSVLPKLIYWSNAIPIKISGNYFMDTNKLILKFTWRGKRLTIANIILKEKNERGGLMLSNFKTYYKVIVIKTMWYLRNNRQIGQWNRREHPEIGPHKYSQLIFDKRAKAIQWSKDSHFYKWCWNNWTSTHKKGKSIFNKQMLREYITTRRALQEMLKRNLQDEIKGY